MKSTFKNICFLLLLVISYSSFGQNNNLDRVAVTKKVRLLDSTQFVYIVNEKGVNFLTFLCNDDMKDFSGFLMITYEEAIKKDAKVKDIPYVAEGHYIFWDNENNSWITKEGSLNEVLTKIAGNK